MFKIALASDLHLEFGTIALDNTEGAKVLILAGDILTANPLHEHPHGTIVPPPENYIWKPGKNQVLAMRYRAFLDQVTNEFEHVVAIAGNHELYHGRFPDAYDWLRTEYGRYPNIHFLQNDQVEIDGVTFLGGTLWTDFNKRDPLTLRLIANMMNDFRVVINSDRNWRRFAPGDALHEHIITRDYFKHVLDNAPDKRYVVVGHHAPSPLSVHPRFAKDTIANGGYFSDLSEFILDHPQIKLWVHGHMHDPQTHYMGDTLIAANPRGYANHDPEAANFKLRFFDLDNMPDKFEGVRWGRE